MSPIYIETSALLTTLLRQDGYTQIIDYVEGPGCCSSCLTFVEARRTFARLVYTSELTEADYHFLQGILTTLSVRWTVLEITKSIQTRAGNLFPLEPVRALDAIHLATALEFVELYGEIKILSLDQRIIGNLSGLGLKRVD